MISNDEIDGTADGLVAELLVKLSGLGYGVSRAWESAPTEYQELVKRDWEKTARGILYAAFDKPNPGH